MYKKIYRLKNNSIEIEELDTDKSILAHKRQDKKSLYFSESELDNVLDECNKRYYSRINNILSKMKDLSNRLNLLIKEKLYDYDISVIASSISHLNRIALNLELKMCRNMCNLKGEEYRDKWLSENKENISMINNANTN